jgi:hypothetical protein
VTHPPPDQWRMHPQVLRLNARECGAGAPDFPPRVDGCAIDSFLLPDFLRYLCVLQGRLEGSNRALGNLRVMQAHLRRQRFPMYRTQRRPLI